MSMEIKRLARFLLLSLVTVVVIDFLVGTGLSYLYGQMQGGERARANEAITQSIADVYVMGSSRALHHYIPSIISDSLGCSVYNAGRPAQTMLYQRTLLELILRRHTPKLIVLDINEDEFVYEERKHDLLNVFLPYYRDEPAVRHEIDRINPGYKWLRWSFILPYNSSVFAVLYRSIWGRPDSGYDRGFVPKIGKKAQTKGLYNACERKFIIDTVMVSAFREFVSLCKSRDIQLVVFVSPRFEVRTCEREDLKFVKNKLELMSIPLFDLSEEHRYIDNLAFMYDIPHLNLEGASAFSMEVGSRLKVIAKCR